jgi:hypothetical protein
VLVVGANKVSVAIARLLDKIENIDVTVVDSNRKRVQYSRIDGVKALHTSIFSTKVLEDIQLGAYQYLISLTENDEINALSCIQYSEIIGAANVFRFPPSAINASQPEGLKMVELGHNITQHDFQFFLGSFENNDSFKSITIIQDMSLDDFKSQYGANFVPVIGVSSSSQIKKAKNTEEFLKGDCWIVFDAKKVSLPEDHSVD